VGADARETRRDALIGRLEERGLDGLLVSHLPNVRYLSGFTGTAALLAVLRSGELVFVSDFRYAAQAEAEVGSLARLEIVPSDPLGRLLGLLAGYGGTERLGYEGHAVAAATASRLEANEGRQQFTSTSGLVEGLRICKDAAEVTAIRSAAVLALEAFEATVGSIRPGEREIDVAARLESELRRRGSEWHPFPTIVASGPRAALPHAGTSRRVIERGDLLLLDFGAQVGGYCADVTRTVVVGAVADDRQRAVYDLVRTAQALARERVAAGMTGREADALARAVIAERGFGDAFGHSLGHGLGLEVHEEPRLSATSETALPVGAVVTIEPGIYIPGWGGVRLEDDVAITADGPLLLTDGNTDLRELV
jgi:Xaa-Pro aminopeptidase